MGHSVGNRSHVNQLDRKIGCVHKFSGQAQLSADTTTLQSFTLPLLCQDEAQAVPNTVVVNPHHDDFVIRESPNCNPESVVNSWFARLTVTKMLASGSAILTPVKLHWTPMYFAFKESYDASDSKTGTDVKTLLRMQYETTDKQGFPLWSTVDLLASSIAPSDQQGNAGLIWETVGMTEAKWQLIADARMYYTNKGMLRKVAPRTHHITLTKERSTRTIFMRGKINGKVKRMNDYTWCGIMFYCPHGGDKDQIGEEVDYNTVPHIKIDWDIQFFEHNTGFYQESL